MRRGLAFEDFLASQLALLTRILLAAYLFLGRLVMGRPRVAVGTAVLFVVLVACANRPSPVGRPSRAPRVVEGAGAVSVKVLQLAEGYLHSVFPCSKGEFGEVLAQAATTVNDLQRLEPDTPVVDDWVTRAGLAPDTPIYAVIWGGDCTWEDDDGSISQLVEARMVFFADGNGIITRGAEADQAFQSEHAFDPSFQD